MTETVLAIITTLPVLDCNLLISAMGFMATMTQACVPQMGKIWMAKVRKKENINRAPGEWTTGKSVEENSLERLVCNHD